MLIEKTFYQGYGERRWAVRGWYLFGFIPLYVQKVKVS